MSSFFNEFLNKAPRTYTPPLALMEANQFLVAQAAAPSRYDTRDRLNEVAKKLQRVIDLEVAPSSFSDREIRSLAWALNHGEPPLSQGPALKAALDIFFLHQCEPKKLNGLISTFLSAKDVPIENLAAWAKVIHLHLVLYKGQLDELLHWKRHAALVFAPDAANKVGKWCLEHDGSLADAFKTLRLPVGSSVGTLAVQSVIRAVAGSSQFPRRIDEVLKLVEPLGMKPIKQAIEAFLERFALNPGIEPFAPLIDLALLHLGDPRLKRNTQWLDISERARKRMISWIAHRDLNLFFRAVAMDDDRRQFWLRYVDQITYSRLVLGDDVARRSDPAIHEFLKQKLHARLQDGDPSVSAFIIQIQDILFVEFSQSGDACYMYRYDEHQIDLELPSYVRSELRRQWGQSRGSVLKNRIPDWIRNPNWTRSRDNRIVHQGAWQYNAASKLRILGIEAAVSRYR